MYNKDLRELYFQREEISLKVAREIIKLASEFKYFYYDIAWLVFNTLDNSYRYGPKERIKDRFYYKKLIKDNKNDIKVENSDYLFVGEMFADRFVDNLIRWQNKQPGNVPIVYKEIKSVKIIFNEDKLKSILKEFLPEKNISHILAKIDFYANRRWNILYNLSLQFKALLNELKPQVIILQHDRKKEYLIFNDIAQEKGIKTIVYQHGFTPYREYIPMGDLSYIPLYSDKIFVWGNIGLNYFLNKGIARNRIVVTGNYKWTKFLDFRSNPHYESYRFNVFITQQFIGLREWEEDIRKIIQPFLFDKNWIIKGRNRNTDMKLKGQYVYGNIEDILSVIKIAVTPFSAASVELLFAGIPVIMLNPYGGKDLVGLKDIAPIVSCKEELDRAISTVKKITDNDIELLKDLFGYPVSEEKILEYLFY